MDEIKIIKYLDEEMKGEELRKFEEEVKMNPQLADEVNKFREIQDLAKKLLADQDENDQGKEFTARIDKDEEMDPAVQKEISEAVIEFKKHPSGKGDIPPGYVDKLKDAEKNLWGNRSKSGSLQTIHRIWYSAAAVVILAITISILVFKPFSNLPAGEIYAQYFRTFTKTDEIMELARDDNNFLFATEVYEAGDFERAAVLFEILADSSQVRPWSMFYAGCSYMSLNQSDKAIDLFKSVIVEGDEEVSPLAQWQLGLCYLKTGDIGQAKEQLKIVSDDPAFRKDAVRILRVLE
jgi:tetratricopeptide (TPR) repeat protein